MSTPSRSSYLAIDGANNYGDNYLGTTLRNTLSPFISAVENHGDGNLEKQANSCISFAAANGPYVADLYLNSGVAPTQGYCLI